MSHLFSRQHFFQSHDLSHDNILVTLALKNNYTIIVFRNIYSIQSLAGVSLLLVRWKYSKISSIAIILHIVEYFY